MKNILVHVKVIGPCDIREFADHFFDTTSYMEGYTFIVTNDKVELRSIDEYVLDKAIEFLKELKKGEPKEKILGGK